MTPMIKRLNEILAEHATKRVNGKVASDRTTTGAGETLRTCFNDLHRIGYKLIDPMNLSEKHITALCEHWHTSGKALSTIRERLSRVRIFCEWVGKNGMVKSLPYYLPNVDPKELKLSKVAKVSKSWSEHGIDVIQKIREADELDTRFGLMLRVSLAFGLRRMEVVQLRPWKSDKGDKLAVYEAKNGRPRDVYIDTPEQRIILDLIKGVVKKGDTIGWRETIRGEKATLEYSIQRYNKCMLDIGLTREICGTTGHGLRAQFAENMAIVANMIPATLGGTNGQMSKEDINLKLAQVSELLGHSRISVTSAYYGSFGRKINAEEIDRTKKNLEHGLNKLRQKELQPVKAERLDDCMYLVKELAVLEIDATPAELQVLWEYYSLRHGSPWVKPAKTNVIALEVAATSRKPEKITEADTKTIGLPFAKEDEDSIMNLDTNSTANHLHEKPKQVQQQNSLPGL